jgi:hypothetical protein
MSSRWFWAPPALLALLAVDVACTRRSPRDDSQASETHTTGGELTAPGWTKVTPRPLGGTDVLRPAPEERAADATELPQLAPGPEPTSTEEPTAAAPTATPTPLAEPPLPDWVPTSGRLTIVGASDLARNLGMVDELDDDAGAATTSGANPTNPPNPTNPAPPTAGD